MTLAARFLPMNDTVRIVIYLTAYLVAGYDVVWTALRNIVHGELFDECFLMTVASIGALCLQDFTEGIAVMVLYQLGEMLQDMAVDKSRGAISELMDIRPDSARLEKDGQETVVSPAEVAVGSVIVVRPGEKIPLDGVVLTGESSLDTAALTGESMPRHVREGSEVLSGCINQTSLLRIRTTQPFETSTASRILEMVSSASDKKAKTDQFITRFSRIYTPVVVGLAVLLAIIPPLVTDMNFAPWISRALTFLVISCPCALVISVPLTFFSGIGCASQRGVLVKGANSLEMLADTGIAVFDKTGTLTQGVFSVVAVHPKEVSDRELVHLAASLEKNSNHPIAVSLREKCEEALSEPADVEEVAGKGLRGTVEGKSVWAGNAKLMAEADLEAPPCHRQGTIVHMAVDGVYCGHIVIADQVKKNAREALKGLKELGVRKTVMLTGDSASAAQAAAEQVGVDQVEVGLLPDGKVEKVEALLKEKKEKENLIFVGDGVNDAPVLARADVGVAMGAMGSDAAIEAADVVLMDDDPQKLVTAVRVARGTVAICKQNIVFALAVKAIVMALGAMGLASMWLAVFADVGVCLLAVANAMRAMRIR
ncbi:MAG: cadmium-translocating P-type ATPase [Clostridiales bacterium]|nr:cadmium-translocating P-type ATPase [Clostridiales bacterium]